MAGTASVMAVDSTGDFVHGLPERLERTGRGLGHVIGGTAAGTAAATTASASSMEHGRQLGHRGLLHGQLGILILNVPPAVGQDLGTAATIRRCLLIDTDAPMVSVSAVSIDVVQGQAMTDVMGAYVCVGKESQNSKARKVLDMRVLQPTPLRHELMSKNAQKPSSESQSY